MDAFVHDGSSNKFFRQHSQQLLHHSNHHLSESQHLQQHQQLSHHSNSNSYQTEYALQHSLEKPLQHVLFQNSSLPLQHTPSSSFSSSSFSSSSSSSSFSSLPLSANSMLPPPSPCVLTPNALLTPRRSFQTMRPPSIDGLVVLDSMVGVSCCLWDLLREYADILTQYQNIHVFVSGANKRTFACMHAYMP